MASPDVKQVELGNPDGIVTFRRGEAGEVITQTRKQVFDALYARAIQSIDGNFRMFGSNEDVVDGQKALDSFGLSLGLTYGRDQERSGGETTVDRLSFMLLTSDKNRLIALSKKGSEITLGEIRELISSHVRGLIIDFLNSSTYFEDHNQIRWRK